MKKDIKTLTNKKPQSTKLHPKEIEILQALKMCNSTTCKKCSSCRSCRSCGPHIVAPSIA